jgi:hypothetical protein
MDQQLREVCENRTDILTTFVHQAFEAYQKRNGGKRPEMIAIYRDGVGGPISERFVSILEGTNGKLQNAIKTFANGYNPKILYVMINKKTGTRMFEEVNHH